MSLYVAAYDVSDSLRRSSVARVLGRYGHRLQRSVFEVWLEPEELGELKRGIGALLDADDSFDLFPIDTRPKSHRIRWQREPQGYDPVVLL
jgi:CRISPR-associated endonuclease Cas2